jgi:alkylated DNA repair dioxygenase AlkB
MNYIKSKVSSLKMRNQSIVKSFGEAILLTDAISPEIASAYFSRLRKEIQWHQEPIRIFGKWIPQPRLTAFYGDPQKTYRYSGLTMKSLPWTACLLELRNLVQDLAEETFTSALLNLYRNGDDSMGWHRDNEPELGINPVIASLSFGATRSFRFRLKGKKSSEISIDLQNGSLLIMKGAIQTHWEHSLPKTKKPIGERINITFRKII